MLASESVDSSEEAQALEPATVVTANEPVVEEEYVVVYDTPEMTPEELQLYCEPFLDGYLPILQSAQSQLQSSKEGVASITSSYAQIFNGQLWDLNDQTPISAEELTTIVTDLLLADSSFV